MGARRKAVSHRLTPVVHGSQSRGLESYPPLFARGRMARWCLAQIVELRQPLSFPAKTRATVLKGGLVTLPLSVVVETW